MEGTILNARRFDEMLEPILAEDAHCVVDTGTSSFVAVSHYLIENDVHEQIRLSGKKVVVHAIIVGGSTLKETLNDLYELARQLPPEVDIVVWLNEHFGLIKQGDKTFTDMEVFKQNRHRIRGTVHLPLRTASVEPARDIDGARGRGRLGRPFGRRDDGFAMRRSGRRRSRVGTIGRMTSGLGAMRTLSTRTGVRRR